ncbi:hypothetical protein FCF16_02275 [Lentilactobacillus buchneri]|nr:hypothetical protein [Lentilactobacillus buchneri]MCT3542699.1 hypothetical protein [Lentilactobacillus buchneri]MCT3545840.1 hypothetical protein [Lentilactobacillus buchneri]MCT3552808.1 hypothetical protein [Lentilactobacillus buchneri]TJY02687.1 hypothetical protein FCF17_00450 [Lentilactobacillus buchneri]
MKLKRIKRIVKRDPTVAIGSGVLLYQSYILDYIYNTICKLLDLPPQTLYTYSNFDTLGRAERGGFMSAKRIVFAIIFVILNVVAAYFLVDPFMSIVYRRFQEADFFQIILVLTITLALDIGTFQEVVR